MNGFDFKDAILEIYGGVHWKLHDQATTKGGNLRRVDFMFVRRAPIVRAFRDIKDVDADGNAWKKGTKGYISDHRVEAASIGFPKSNQSPRSL